MRNQTLVCKRYLAPLLGLQMLFASTLAADEGQHRLYTELLREYVDDAGLVNYRKLAEDERLPAYLQQLEQTDPSALSSDDRQAFWYNAYNAFTLQLIADHYPLKSIHELHKSISWKLAVVGGKSIWDADLVTINGKTMSLFDIEKREIWDAFGDARAHFALVCAAKSCPKLRREAYEGYKLDQQLDDQARLFLGNAAKNSYDVEARKASLSQIFNWYKKHFGKNRKKRILYIAQYVPEDVAKSMRANPSSWKIRHLSYDWDLNEQ